MNSLAALAAVEAVGGDVGARRAGARRIRRAGGRGAQITPSTSAAAASRSSTKATMPTPPRWARPSKCSAALPRDAAARRIAVIGDMLELGEHSEALHEGLPARSRRPASTLYSAAGRIWGLCSKTAASRRGAWTETSEKLKDTVLDAIRPGDAIMIKGSLGSRMGLLIDAIRQTYPQRAAARTIAAE